jgi:hypothetical protein
MLSQGFMANPPATCLFFLALTFLMILLYYMYITIFLCAMP